MRRQVCHHRSESCSESSHVCGNGSAARCRGLRCGFICKALAGHAHESFLRCCLRRILDKEFHHFFTRIKRLEVIKSHGLYCDLHDLLFRDTGRALLLLEEITSGLDEGALRNETYDLGSGNAEATGLCGTAYLVESDVKRGRVYICDVHRNLCDSVFIDEPAYGLAAFQCTRNHHRPAVLVLHDLACDRIAFPLRTAFLTHVECDGICTAG